MAIHGSRARAATRRYVVWLLRMSLKPAPAIMGSATWRCSPSTPTNSSRVISKGWLGRIRSGEDPVFQRSPIHHTENLSCGLILFQGLDDKIVLPNQAEMMFEAVQAKGLPVAYLAFEGEGHGFRQSSTVKRALEAELYFYSKVFGFELAEAIEPVEIVNL